MSGNGFCRPQGKTLLAGLVLAFVSIQPVGAVSLIDGPRNPVTAGRVQLALESYRLLDAYPDRTFQGTRQITRYELADALGRSQLYIERKYQLKWKPELRLVASLEGYFQPSGDVPRRHWAGNAVLSVMAAGLLQGDPERLKFYGGLKVSRYQLAHTISRFYQWLQISPEPLQKVSFRDLPQNHWAFEAVQAVTAAGIMEGEGNAFKGEEAVDRTQLAEALVRMLQQVDLVALKRPLVPQTEVQIEMPQLPARPDGRRQPVFYQSSNRPEPSISTP